MRHWGLTSGLAGEEGRVSSEVQGNLWQAWGVPGAEILVPPFQGELIYPRSLGFSLWGAFRGCRRVGPGNVLTQPCPVDGFTVETCFIEFVLNWGAVPAECGEGPSPAGPGRRDLGCW